jgi:hypothetical protein
MLSCWTVRATSFAALLLADLRFAALYPTDLYPTALCPAAFLNTADLQAAALQAGPQHLLAGTQLFEALLACARAVEEVDHRLISGCSGIQTPSFRTAFPEPPHTP